MYRFLLCIVLPAIFCSCAGRHYNVSDTYARYGLVGHRLSLWPDGSGTWYVSGCLDGRETKCTWLEKDKRVFIFQQKEKQDSGSINLSILMTGKVKKEKIVLISTANKSKLMLWREHLDVFSAMQ